MPIFAINDLKHACKNKVFSKCQVVFRNGLATTVYTEKLKLSQLVNPKLVTVKDKVVCYCDGIVEAEVTVTVTEKLPTILHNEPEPVIEEPDSSEEEFFARIKNEERYYEQLCELIGVDQDEYPYEPIDVKPLYAWPMSAAKRMDRNEEREEIFQKEKRKWVREHPQFEQLKLAVERQYQCDDEYAKIRASLDYPEFELLDHTAFYWSTPYPSLKALKLEKAIANSVNMMNRSTDYGSFVRIALLEEYKGEKINKEMILIYRYLGKFELGVLVEKLTEGCLDGYKFGCNGRKILCLESNEGLQVSNMVNLCEESFRLE